MACRDKAHGRVRSAFGARVSGMAVKGCSSVSEVGVSPKLVICDGAESALMALTLEELGLMRCWLITGEELMGQAF